jgi:hypothetical protein
MFDPLTLLLVGAGALAFREMNKKDYGVLTAARDERYRVVMANCYDPQGLLTEAKLFADHGLAAQAAMLKRRAEWRARPDDVKKAHEDIFQKAMRSTNIPAILQVAASFEGWTATKKASALRQHVQKLQEEMLQQVSKAVAETKKDEEKQEEEHSTGPNGTIPQNESEQ